MMSKATLIAARCSILSPFASATAKLNSPIATFECDAFSGLAELPAAHRLQLSLRTRLTAEPHLLGKL